MKKAIGIVLCAVNAAYIAQGWLVLPAISLLCIAGVIVMEVENVKF